MPRAIAEVDSDLGTLKGQVAGLDTRIAVLDKGNKGIEQSILDFKSSVERQINSLDDFKTSLAEKDKLIHALTIRLEADVKATDSTVQAHSGELSAYKPQFDRLTNDFEKWGARVWALTLGLLIATVTLLGTALLAYFGLKK